MPIAGRQLTIEEALALCYVIGWRAKQLRWAVAIMWAESGRYVEAYHDNVTATGELLSTDRGLFQINDVAHPSLSDADAFKAVPNARYAYKLWVGAGGWTPWAVYNHRTFKKYVPDVYDVWVLKEWRKLIPTIEAGLA